MLAYLESRQREVDRIKSEVAPALHVVNVAPHDIQRDVGLCVIVHDLLHLPDAAVSIPAEHQLAS